MLTLAPQNSGTRRRTLEVALIRLLVHTDPLCGVKLPQAAFLPLPVFHTVPSSECEMCVKQISMFSPATPVAFFFFFYNLGFSLNIINLPFAFNIPSCAVPRITLESVYHIHRIIQESCGERYKYIHIFVYRSFV